MEICKAPTIQLKALNKHSITHIMYIEMEMLSAIKNVCKNKIVIQNFPHVMSLCYTINFSAPFVRRAGNLKKRRKEKDFFFFNQGLEPLLDSVGAAPRGKC